MSLFEEPHLEPQPEPEKPKKKKLLSIGIGAALIVAVLVTSVLAFSFGQSGKPSDNIPDAPQQEEIQTPADTDIPPDESTDTEKPEGTTPSESTQKTPSTSGKQDIDPSTGKDKYQTDPVPDGKPAPAEPEDTEVDTSTKYTCTISITCKTILDNMDKVKESKKGHRSFQRHYSRHDDGNIFRGRKRLRCSSTYLPGAGHTHGIKLDTHLQQRLRRGNCESV